MIEKFESTNKNKSKTLSRLDFKDPIHEGNSFSSGGSSTSNSKKHLYENGIIAKEIDMLIRDDKRTPKSLKHILWLVLINLLTILAVSSVNLGMYVEQMKSTQ